MFWRLPFIYGYNLIHSQHNHQHDQIMYRQINWEKDQTNVRCWKPYMGDANMAAKCIWESRLASMYLMRLQNVTDICIYGFKMKPVLLFVSHLHFYI